MGDKTYRRRSCGTIFFACPFHLNARPSALSFNTTQRRLETQHQTQHVLQEPDPVEGYPPRAIVARVPGHRPFTNTEKTANPDPRWFQD